MAQLNFPDTPIDGQLYPNPCPTGVTQYRWDSSTGIWRIVGVATGVTPGQYGNDIQVGQFTVDSAGKLTQAASVPIRGATVTQTGVVQLNDTTFGVSTEEALTARAGKYLQDQIGNLSTCLVPDHTNVVAALNDLQRQTIDLQTGALIWCGYYNAEEGDISFVSISGQRLGYQIGQELPLASLGNGGDFFVVTKAGNPYVAGDFNAPDAYIEQGNWIVSEAVKWTEVTVVGEIQAKDVTYVPSSPLTSTNVQNALTQITQLFRTGIGGATVSPSRPSNPYPGQLWWDSDDGLFYVFYSDINGSQWVEAGGGGSQSLQGGSGTVYEIRTGVGLNGGPITTEGEIYLEPAFVNSANPGLSTIGGVIPTDNFRYDNTTGTLKLKISGDYNGKDPATAFSQEGANLLNNKIDSLTGTNVLAGTYSARLGQMTYVTPAGLSKGFVDGQNLPPASVEIDNYYVIVTSGGDIGPDGSGEPSSAGDWWICNADVLPPSWILIDYEFASQQASNVVVRPIPGIAQANDVQRALELVELQAQDRIEFAEAKTDGIQITVSDPSTTAYDGTTLSIGLDYASVKDRGIVQLTNDVRGSSETIAITQRAASELNAKIESLIGANVLAGTYNSNTGVVVAVTGAGSAAGFVVGQQAPEASKVPDGYYIIVTVPGGYGPPDSELPPGGVQSGDWFIVDNTGSGAKWLTVDYDSRTVDATNVNLSPIPGLTASNVQNGLLQIQEEVLTTVTGVATSNNGLTVTGSPSTSSFGIQYDITLNPSTATDIGGVFVAPNLGLVLTEAGGLSLGVASGSRLGGIKVGNNLSIAPDGTLSAPDQKQADAKIEPVVDISPLFNDATTTFELELVSGDPIPKDVTAQKMLISVGGILQDPLDSYIYEPNTSRITFTSPPPKGATFSGRVIIAIPVAGAPSTVVNQVIGGNGIEVTPVSGYGVVTIDAIPPNLTQVVRTPSMTRLKDISGDFDGVKTVFPVTLIGGSRIPNYVEEDFFFLTLDGLALEPGEDFFYSEESVTFSVAPQSGSKLRGRILNYVETTQGVK